MLEVLLVEDDSSVRSAFIRVLRHAEFDVTVAENGVMALQLLSELKEFDAIVCDYRMPDLGGRGFYEQLEEKFPNLASRVVFVTGYFNDPKIRKFLDGTGQPVLGKPVETKDLVDAVREIVSRNRT